MKKLFGLILALCLVLCVSLSVSAEGGTVGDIQWNYTGGTLTFTGTGPMEDACVDLESRPWHSLAAKAKKVVVGEGITSLDWSCLADFTALTEVSLPSTLTELESQAFRGCTSLKTITLPEGCDKLGSFLFQDCTSLTSIKLSSTTDSLPIYCFSGCTGLKTYTIPAHIKTIGNSAFEKSGLQHITVPATVESLGEDAFYCCVDLKTYDLQNEMLTMPAGLFMGCTSLTEAYIPACVQIIDDDCFHGCTGVKNITFTGRYLWKIEGGAFHECSGVEELVIPDSVTTFGDGALQYMTGLKKVTFGRNISMSSFRVESAYTQHPFTGCDHIEEYVVVPSNTDWKSYNGSVYSYDMTYLYMVPTHVTTYDIPSTVQYVEPYAFRECRDLETVTVPESLLKLKKGAFLNCESLTSIYLPAGLKEIGFYAFDGSGLKTVYFGGSQAQWDAIDLDERFDRVLEDAQIVFNAKPGDSQGTTVAPDPKVLFDNMIRICQTTSLVLRYYLR